MSRFPVLLALTAVMTASALPGPAMARKRPQFAPGLGTANPSALVATEIALNRLAAKKGDAKAMRKFADDDASVVSGEGKREAYNVWMSCDGTAGVTQGLLKGADGGPTGSYVTVWKKRKKGIYRWVADQTDGRVPLVAEPDMVSAKVAACTGRRAAAASDRVVVVTAPLASSGVSEDGTLSWSIRPTAACGHSVSVRLLQDGSSELAQVVNATFTPKNCGA